jgi:hypothetical protein
LAQVPYLVLDSSCNNSDKYKLIVWPSHNGANQQWKFVADGQGNFSIVNAQNGGTL